MFHQWKLYPFGVGLPANLYKQRAVARFVKYHTPDRLGASYYFMVAAGHNTNIKAVDSKSKFTAKGNDVTYRVKWPSEDPQLHLAPTLYETATRFISFLLTNSHIHSALLCTGCNRLIEPELRRRHKKYDSSRKNHIQGCPQRQQGLGLSPSP
jgi:hypothetical protein